MAELQNDQRPLSASSLVPRHIRAKPARGLIAYAIIRDDSRKSNLPKLTKQQNYLRKTGIFSGHHFTPTERTQNMNNRTESALQSYVSLVSSIPQKGIAGLGGGGQAVKSPLGLTIPLGIAITDRAGAVDDAGARNLSTPNRKPWESTSRVLLRLLCPNAQKRLAFPSNESMSVHVRG